jgi:hypothetical protein
MLKLKSGEEWKDYCKAGLKPDDIPANPFQIYKQDGWKGFGDWLGSGTVATQLREYRLFEEARDFVHMLKLKSGEEWKDYCKAGLKPDDIPSFPNKTYKQDGWKTMGDWLGAGTVASRLKKYRPFEEARDFVQKLKLKGQKEWFDYCKSGQKPDNIPVAPNQTYKQDGWKGFGDWLGSGTVATYLREYKSFEEARDFVHKLKLNSQKEWLEYCKAGQKPEDIPASPHSTYKQDGWKGFGDWLGTGTVANQLREYKSFEEARDFVHMLKLKSGEEWFEYCQSGQKPDDIPSFPNKTYKQDGWKTMGDWLGTGSVANFLREYKSFEEARDFVHNLNLKNLKEWKEYCKSGLKPEDVSTNPNRTYKQDGWNTWGDWLGSGTVASRLKKYRTFEEARDFVHRLKLKSVKEWKDYCKAGQKPEDIPAKPERTYKQDGWKGLGDWLGTGSIASFLREYKPFEEAREFVHKLELKSGEEWKDYCKSGQKPEDIPAYPNQTYKQVGWKGMGDWLGY